MWRTLPGGWLLSELVPSDVDAIALHLADGTVAKTLLRVPYPYERKDAEAFLAIVGAADRKAGRTENWAIRESDGRLVGVIGLHAPAEGDGKTMEIGYWLAEPYWGRGIMREALRRIVNVALVEYEIDRLEAGVLLGNDRSAKLLVANGFELVDERADLSVDGRGPRWGRRYALDYERYAAMQKR